MNLTLDKNATSRAKPASDDLPLFLDPSGAGLAVLLGAASTAPLRRALWGGNLDPAAGRELARRIITTSKSLLRLTTDAALSDNSSKTVAVWFKQMADHVGSIHTAVSLAIAGSVDPPDVHDQVVARSIRKQLRYLKGFASAVIDASQALGSSAAARAAMYAASAWATGQAARRSVLGELAARERRVLGNADHCSVCLALEALSWQPIGTLPSIGDSPCQANCLCHFEFQGPGLRTTRPRQPG